MRPKDIERLRISLNLTQEEFAKKLGLRTRGAVSALERGHHEAKGPLLRLLQILKANPKVLENL